MMLDTEADLSLSLSLNLTHITTQKLNQKQHQPFPNNVHTANMFSSLFNSSFPHRASFNPFLPGVDQTLMMRKSIDVNRQPTNEDYNDDATASSPNSTTSTLSGKRTERDEQNNNQNDINDHLDRAACSGSDDELDGDNTRKKLRLSKEQSALLEETFKDHNTLIPKHKTALAKQLGLRPRQVEVWFQNRRARTKLKQTEVDCEFLKRCCENLTEENRRLQKEVQELRALKLSPQFYMQMAPPTTLTMCPSCERVGPPTRMV